MACRSEEAPARVSFAPAATPASLRGPIGVSANGHYFVDRDGQPFFWLGDTAWPLLVEYPTATALRYLSNRAE